jgi:diguanylate cyclase (GGDEF)-like protein
LIRQSTREWSSELEPIGDEQPLAFVVDAQAHVKVIEGAGFDVASVDGVLEAATLLRRIVPDIVIVGMRTGESAHDALAVVRTTRESCHPAGMPVVVVTDEARANDIELAYSAGATDVWLISSGPVILKQRLRFLMTATQAFEQLGRSSQKLERAQRLARFATWEWCFQTGHVRWSSELRHLLASCGPDAAGLDAVMEMVHPAERARVAHHLSEGIEHRSSFTFDHRALRNDGSELVLHQEAELILDDTGSVIGIDGFAVDITALKTAEGQLHSLANYDRLTGLPNRMSFLDHVTRACERAERRSDSAAVALLDIDRFRGINDSLGHRAGDQLLRDVADRLARCLRKGDFVAREGDGMLARRGGDEFLMLLSDVEEAHHVAIAARRILESLSRPFRVAGKEIHLTGSIGIALTDDTAPEAEELIRHAEIAMYNAKNSGGNNFEFFDAPMNRKIVERFDMEERLRRAMAREELILFYQPLVNTQTRTLVGVEALIRWNHPTRGLLSADEFIPLAEETGIIVPIGRWVVRTACEQLRRWRTQGYRSMRLSVNVSPRELRAPGFIASMASILEETEIRPGQLEVEITERGVMRNDQPTLDVLLHLRGMGVRLAVDDFGTGYTMFHYLKHFPLNTLKIDKSFTRGIVVDGKDAAITKALLAMAHRFELNVVAEGVENEAQLSFLGQNRCDEVQGYLFGKPIPAEELARTLREYAVVVRS